MVEFNKETSSIEKKIEAEQEQQSRLRVADIISAYGVSNKRLLGNE